MPCFLPPTPYQVPDVSGAYLVLSPDATQDNPVSPERREVVKEKKVLKA